MRDTNLCLRTSAAQTQTGVGSAVDFGGPDVQPMGYVVYVSAVAGTSPTLDIDITQCATSGGTYEGGVEFPQITAVGVYRRTGKLTKRYRKVSATIGGTGPSFTYEVYGELGGQYESF